ncbi:MAG: glycosyltransferase family 2 protein [Bacteroidales bacterium]|nr:glycosyltransferase family 2 protein [Bacteroidales bacterium]
MKTNKADNNRNLFDMVKNTGLITGHSGMLVHHNTQSTNDDPIGCYFSVIIPCYNVSKYLRRCLDTVINQSFPNIEIILIDDKSTDDSLSIIHEYEHKDERIRVIAHDKNYGVARARNSGMKIASGKYASFIDPDDYLDIDFYEKLYLKSIANDADIVKGAAFGVKDIASYIPINKYFFYAQWWSAVYKLELLRKYHILFPEDVFCGQDFVFQRHACIKAKDIVLVNDTHYHYCKRKDSLDSQYFSQKKIVSQLLARKYIVMLSNNLIEDKADYLLVISRVFSEIEWLWSKTNNKKSHYYLCKKYIELFDIIKHKAFFANTFPMLYVFMQKGDVEGLFKHLCLNYKKYKYTILETND